MIIVSTLNNNNLVEIIVVINNQNPIKINISNSNVIPQETSPIKLIITMLNSIWLIAQKL